MTISAEFLNSSVTLRGVADTPILLNASSDHDWSVAEDPDSPGQIILSTTVLEDEAVSMSVDILSGEIYTRLAGDTSETLSLVLKIPNYVELINDDVLVYMGSEGEFWIFEVDPADLPSLSVRNPTHDTRDMDIGVTIHVHENDGNAAQTEGSIKIHFEPVIDATDYTKTFAYENDCPSQSVTEDNLITLDFIPGLVDSKEEVVQAKISGLPANAKFYEGNTLLWDSTAIFELDDALLARVLSGASEITLLPPEDSDLDINLTAILQINQTDEDSSVVDTKEIVGTLVIDIRAAVEADGYLNVYDTNGDLETFFNPDESSNGGKVTIGSVVFIEDDASTPTYSSVEAIESMVLQFPASQVRGYDIPNAIGDGRGNWYVDGEGMRNITIEDNLRVGGSFDIVVHGSVVDQGDNNEGDASCSQIFQKTVTLNFTGATGGGPSSCVLPNLNLTYPEKVRSVEDTELSVDSLLDALLTTQGNYSRYRLSIVIPETSLYDYPSTTVSGMKRDFVREQWVASASADHDSGIVAFPQVTLTPPQDFAGEFYLNGSVNVFATCSKEQRTQSFQILVQYAPKVDTTPDFDSSEITFNIVNLTTHRLDANKVPIVVNETAEQLVEGSAIEDGAICFRLDSALVDKDTSASRGIETVLSYELRLTDSSLGSFYTDSNNLEAATAEYANSSGTDTYCFKPTKDYSGEIQIDLDAKIKDFVFFNISGDNATSIGVVTSQVTLDVVPACDAMTVSFQGLEAQNENTYITGVVNVTVGDEDGSETPNTIIFYNVPTDFIFKSPAKLVGDGEWKVDLDAQGLASISILPPERFSGIVNISAQVLASEELLPFDQVCTVESQFNLTVLPVAEALDNSMTTSYSGTEHVDITLSLSFSTRDNVNIYDSSDESVLSETAPEGVAIYFEDVPTASYFSAGDYLEVTQLSNTSWKVYTNQTTLSSVTFNPGSANGNFDISAFATAVDGQVEADGDLWTNFTISMTVAEANSPPTINSPDSLTLDSGSKQVTTTEISIADPDSGSEDVFVTLGCTSTCSISINTLPGDVALTNSGPSEVELQGPVSSINTGLASGIVVTSTTSNSFNIDVDDLGNSGPGSAQTTSASVSLIL